MIFMILYIKKGGHGHMNNKKAFFKKMNRIPIKIQLAALVAITFSIIIIIITVYNYQSSTKAVIDQHTEITTTLLKSETWNLDNYFSEIDRYSLLLRHDEKFMQIITTEQLMSYTEKIMVQNLLRNNFDSRNDLLSYSIYLINKQENYKIDAQRHKVQSFYIDSVKELPEYDFFTEGRYYKSLQPSESSDTFMNYYRTIIRIEDQKPLAIVKLTFDTSYIEVLAENHQNIGELFCITDSQGRLFYTNNETYINTETIKEVLAHMEETPENNFKMDINQASYLAVYHNSSSHDFKIVDLRPVSEIDKQLMNARNVSLILGILSITIATVLAFIFIRLVTKPLSALDHRLQRVGSGNFTTTTDIGGSLEIVNLAETFNSMIHQIDDLIKKTYISELNTKTARLIALEAQLNPHFLYNTLQAISAEAVTNEEFHINEMITALASMLRYSIKGEDFVPLEIEVKHVKDYLLLQKARFGERLTYDIQIPDDTKALRIPKISMQTLVENSMIHGMKDNTVSIHIDISCYLDEEYLIVTVRDNGAGILKERMEELNHNFSHSDLNQNKQTGIGLMNLDSRLKLLYDNQAALFLASIPGQETTVTLKIPMGKKEC